MTLKFCDMQSVRSLWHHGVLLWLVSTLVVGCVSDESALELREDGQSLPTEVANGDLGDGKFNSANLGDQKEEPRAASYNLENGNLAPNLVNSAPAVANLGSAPQNLSTSFQHSGSSEAAQGSSGALSQPNVGPTRSLFSLLPTTGSEPQVRQSGPLFAGLFQRNNSANDPNLKVQTSPLTHGENGASRENGTSDEPTTDEGLKFQTSSNNHLPPLPSHSRALQTASPASAFSTAFVANTKPEGSTAHTANIQTASISANDKIGVMRATSPINGTKGGLFASLFKPTQHLEAQTNEKDDIELASLSGLARLSPSALARQTEKVDIDCLKPELVRLLKKVEDHYESPVIVTSGYRSKRENRRIGGAAGSLHTQCEAADVQIDGVSKWALAKYVRTLPERGGVGTYCHTKSVHIDIGPPRDWNWRCRKRKDE